jgi:AraC-like DNA-binding protein
VSDVDAPALLDSTLEQLRLEGAISFRSELSEGFSFESTPQQLADANTDSGVAAVARKLGYDSEEAFSRAFKRAHGASPSHWRIARRSAPAS